MDYYSFSTPDDIIDAQRVLARLMEGICFRYFWATEGLTENDFIFSPGGGSWNLMELNDHIHFLSTWTYGALNPDFKQEKASTFPEVRAQVLANYEASRELLLKMSIEDLRQVRIRELPFWNMINGPWADVLTHIGQINTYRRLNGNPYAGPYSPFSGLRLKPVVSS